VIIRAATPILKPHYPTIRAVFLVFFILIASAVCASAQISSKVLALTEGKRTRIVWIQGSDIKGYDTENDQVVTILSNLDTPGRPLLTRDGNQIIFHTGGRRDGIKDFGELHKTYSVKWDGTGTQLISNNGYLCSLWYDGKQGYAITMRKDRKTYEKIELGTGRTETILNKGSGRGELQFSADGLRAVHAIGSTGWIDFSSTPPKVYKRYGGCRPSMAPDNSYLWFRFFSSHNKIRLFDADGRKWDVMLPNSNEESYYPRWTNDARFLTHTSHGKFSAVFLSRFSNDFKAIEKSVEIVKGDAIYHPNARIGL